MIPITFVGVALLLLFTAAVNGSWAFTSYITRTDNDDEDRFTFTAWRKLGFFHSFSSVGERALYRPVTIYRAAPVSLPARRTRERKAR